ncbi:glycerophosphoryl diester phosphodiesterase [Streptosporangium becharense]|uniref:glycerophosphodiester phosphodiesterase n=1 Tax=Streptosporangium becharense TaxID=1816182 RepID=A0A7W9IGF1_9ACTN|nr:glycerophosphodiester phosphodiesterase family protein [Streptosporangium becharense]MBB2909390.1 glycerophosphoryl diester phosphodiesterase [Streptosporangium becharense]MBB5819653.1 glycerophosphoryl diester phosphodiesterase [Streptosporangium becharense]
MSVTRAGVLAVVIGMAMAGAVQNPKAGGDRPSGWTLGWPGEAGHRQPEGKTAKRPGDRSVGRPGRVIVGRQRSGAAERHRSWKFRRSDRPAKRHWNRSSGRADGWITRRHGNWWTTRRHGSPWSAGTGRARPWAAGAMGTRFGGTRSTGAGYRLSRGTAVGWSALPVATRPDRDDRAPIVIAHRGASAFRPEHTLMSYRAAIRMGADYIEPDLVSTKDHVLVARHENELSATTDVEAHPEFAGRRTTKIVNGRRSTGWFTEDFTLPELRTLRAMERYPKRRRDNTAYDGVALIPTLDEIIRLAQRHGVGVYAETKSPSYFASIGLPLEKPLLETFRRHGWEDAQDPVFIQSFETRILRELRPVTRLRLIQLIGATGAPYDLMAVDDPRTYDDLTTAEGLREIAGYADGIGVSTRRILAAGPGGRLGKPTSLLRDAHRQNLLVHVATIRSHNASLPAEYRRGEPGTRAYRRATGDVAGWLRRLYRLGVDGVFADDPGVARTARDRLRAGRYGARDTTGRGVRPSSGASASREAAGSV